MESTEGNSIYLEEQILFCRLVAVTLGELVPESLAVVRERGGRDEQVMISRISSRGQRKQTPGIKRRGGRLPGDDEHKAPQFP